MDLDPNLGRKIAIDMLRQLVGLDPTDNKTILLARARLPANTIALVRQRISGGFRHPHGALLAEIAAFDSPPSISKDDEHKGRVNATIDLGFRLAVVLQRLPPAEAAAAVACCIAGYEGADLLPFVIESLAAIRDD